MIPLCCVFWRYWRETAGRESFINWAGREMRKWLEGADHA